MILADKITQLRKKSGMSQEELAEKLNVSRQSVSKWESAQSTPDLNRILQMSALFSVSTDVLLKDELDLSQSEDVGMVTAETVSHDEPNPPVRYVTMKEANEFLEKTKSDSVHTAAAVALIILSPVIPILFEAVFGENVLADLGAVFLFLFVAVGVGILIFSSIRMKPFHFFSSECIETEYGIDGMVKEKRAQYQPKYAFSMVMGVALCILSPVMPIIFDSNAGESILADVSAAFIFLFVATGVFMILKASIINGAYKKLLEEDGFSRAQKVKDKKIGGVMGAYWLIATALYLGYSFITMNWGRSWIVWPVAGVLCPVVAMIANAFKNRKAK